MARSRAGSGANYRRAGGLPTGRHAAAPALAWSREHLAHHGRDLARPAGGGVLEWVGQPSSPVHMRELVAGEREPGLLYPQLYILAARLYPLCWPSPLSLVDRSLPVTRDS